MLRSKKRQHNIFSSMMQQTKLTDIGSTKTKILTSTEPDFKIYTAPQIGFHW